MTAIQKKTEVETEVSRFYSKDGSLMATVSQYRDNKSFFVDFYKDEVIIGTRSFDDKTLRYAEDVAENFVDGIITFDKKTWRLHGI